MQNRVAPAARAWRAASSTSPVSISRSALTPVSYRADCGQYAQSSGQPPVLMESRLQSCTFGSPKMARCTVWAR